MELDSEETLIPTGPRCPPACGLRGPVGMSVSSLSSSTGPAGQPAPPLSESTPHIFHHYRRMSRGASPHSPNSIYDEALRSMLCTAGFLPPDSSDIHNGPRNPHAGGHRGPLCMSELSGGTHPYGCIPLERSHSYAIWKISVDVRNPSFFLICDR